MGGGHVRSLVSSAESPSGVVEWLNDDGTPSAYREANLQTTLTCEGTFTYHCAIHPRMKGTVTVTT